MSAPDPQQFDDIRPYNDSEVAPVIERLLATPELIRALSQFRFPRLSRYLPFVIQPLVRTALRKQLAGIDNVRELQQVIASYMQSMIDRTTGKLSFSGIERLDPEQAYLFISNHRDIAMDPAFVNWGLFHNGMDTVRIAIGDNLLRKPYVSDLMRLNKSFIVNRSASGVREKLKALTQLSSYIDHSISSGHSIWLAQREGRAKDGNDRTDPAILKMLHVGPKKRGLSFSEAASALNIVPVSISYEFDPCDAMKARELQALDAEGSYEKSQFEDIDSIVQGIVGYKGDVHVAFGEPVRGEFDSAEALAKAIDAQVVANYHLHASNRLAAGENASDISAAKRDDYNRRLNELAEPVRPWLVAQYANPVTNKQQLEQTEQTDD